MAESLQPTDEEQQETIVTPLDESYVDPETLSPDDVEHFLNEGLVSNIRPIEEGTQKVPVHADRVLLGDMEHKDQVLEADIILPEGKKLLVVYKPESGIGKGPMKGKEITLPDGSSSYTAKEASAWLVAKALGLAHITAPTVMRSLDEGIGSVRPYIWGEPLETSSKEKRDEAFKSRSSLEDIALFDYLLQTLDRRFSNLLLVENPSGNQVKAIDHSLTFVSESFASRFHKKGPRLMIAYDNSQDPPKLRRTPLPERLVASLQNLISQEDQITQALSPLLKDQEIQDLFLRAKKALEQGTFL